MREVLVIGEALVDIVAAPDGVRETPGGSPANVAVALGRWGRDVVLATRLGDDARGSAVREWLHASRVEVAGGSAAGTSTARATLDESGAARYRFELVWDLPDEPLPRAQLVHFGSLAGVLAPGADAVDRAIDRARAWSAVTYDPNIRTALISDPEEARERVARHIARSDLVKASDDDVEWLHPGADPQEVAQAWLEEGPGLVIITQGPRGAFAALPGGVVGVPAPLTRVVDTVGAGDTVMASLIDGLLARSSELGGDVRDGLRSLDATGVEALLEHALADAAVSIARPGADPPWQHER